MDNKILKKIQDVVAVGGHILYVDVTQVSDTEFELRLTLQGNDGWIDQFVIIRGMFDFERLVNIVCRIYATVEMVEDWMLEVAKIGDAMDVAKFEREGYRTWLIKPFAWRIGRT